jgi:hypothetical protein
MRWWIACFAFVVAEAQQANLPQTFLIDQVKARADENLRRLPNYTCTEIIQRSLRKRNERKFRSKDTVRLNVAYVGGKELFGQPGQGRIDQPDVGKAASGTIESGQFAIFLKSIIRGERATFVFLGSTTLEGKKAFHFGYQVPLEQSVYSIRSNAGEAIVGYSGSLWVARDSLDLMRLVVSGDNLAARLWLTSVVTTTDYAQVPIGGKQFLLPVRSAYEAKDLFGSEDRNTTRFENCHEFIGESVLKFGDSDSLPSGK